MGRYKGVLTIFDCYDKQKVESLQDVDIEDGKLAEGEDERINDFIIESIDRYEDESGYEED